MPARSTPFGRPTKVSEVIDLAAIPIFSLTGPSYAGLFGMTSWTAYESARKGHVETVQLLGRRKVVPVAPLLRRLGIEGGAGMDSSWPVAPNKTQADRPDPAGARLSPGLLT